jgi:hypothetical protein
LLYPVNVLQNPYLSLLLTKTSNSVIETSHFKNRAITWWFCKAFRDFHFLLNKQYQKHDLMTLYLTFFIMNKDINNRLFSEKWKIGISIQFDWLGNECCWPLKSLLCCDGSLKSLLCCDWSIKGLLCWILPYDSCTLYLRNDCLIFQVYRSLNGYCLFPNIMYADYILYANRQHRFYLR